MFIFLLILFAPLTLWTVQGAFGAHRSEARDLRRTCPTLFPRRWWHWFA